MFDAHTAPTSGTTPVYRFYNSQTGTHFYTMSEQEKDHVIATYPVFVYEGARYYAPAESAAGRMPLYRFFNTSTGAHFYTTSAEERDHVARTWPWFAFEGTSYYVFAAAASTSGGNTTRNTWRQHDTSAGQHHASTRNHDASARRQYNATAATSRPQIALALSSAVVTVPASITVTATGVGDPDGTVARVSFYMNGAKLVGPDRRRPTRTRSACRPPAPTRSRRSHRQRRRQSRTTLDPNRRCGGGRSAGRDSEARRLAPAQPGDVRRVASRSRARRRAAASPAWIDDQFTQPSPAIRTPSTTASSSRTTPDCTTQMPTARDYPGDSPQAMCARDHLTLAMLQRDFFTNAVYGRRTSCASASRGRCRRSS